MNRRASILDDLDIFAAVAKHLSFKDAAEDLGYTPAGITMAIKRLERRLEIKLFDRTSRSVELTPGGSILNSHLLRAIDAIKPGIELARALRQ